MGKNTDREGPIHLAILNYLRMKYPRALVHHSPNANTMRGKDVARLIAKNKHMGMLPGFPDLIMLHHGTFYAFEVKAPGNKPQDNQLEVGAAIEANGGCFAIVRSIDDVIEAMQIKAPPELTSGELSPGGDREVENE